MSNKDILKQIFKMISSGEISKDVYDKYLSNTPIGFMSYEDLCNKFDIDLLTDEDINFLKDLAHKRKVQSKDGCADPVFWMIQDEKNNYCEDGGYLEFYIDGEVYYDTYREFDQDYFDEFKKYCLDYHLAEDREEFKKIEDNDDLYNYLEWYGLENVSVARFDRTHFITDATGPFLTKEAAKEHLKDNSHHYSKNARTYGMVGWRNPEFERLMEIIEKLDKSE